MMGTKDRDFATLPSVTQEDVIPADHFYRRLARTLDVNVVRDLVRDRDALRAHGNRLSRTHQQVIVPPAHWHAPAQQATWPWQHLVGAGGQLVTIHPRQVVAAEDEGLHDDAAHSALAWPSSTMPPRL